MFTIILAIFGFLFVTALLLNCYFMIRNQKVFNYRIQLINQIVDAARIDLENKLYNYEWRYNMFHSVTHDEMVYTFWRPLPSFYPDKSFLRPQEIQKEKANNHPAVNIFK